MTKIPHSFPGKHHDEIVVLLKRRHWSMLIGKTLRWALLAALPLAILMFLNISSVNYRLDTSTPVGIVLALGASAYALVIWLLFFQDWLDYYLDAFILTNQRIIRIEQRGLFNRIVSSLDLDRIQDVTVEIKGIFSTVLSYGTLTVESAGEQDNFTFSNIPNAESVQSQILMYAKQAPRIAKKPTATVGGSAGSGTERRQPTGTP